MQINTGLYQFILKPLFQHRPFPFNFNHLKEKSLRANDCFRFQYSYLRVCGLSTNVQTIEERKAEVLIKLRKYKLVEKEKFEGAYAYIVDIPQDKERAIIWCILGEATVGIAAMNTLYKIMKEKELERAIVVTEGRYTPRS